MMGVLQPALRSQQTALSQHVAEFMMKNQPWDWNTTEDLIISPKEQYPWFLWLWAICGCKNFLPPLAFCLLMQFKHCWVLVPGSVLLCATVRPQTFGPQIGRDQRLISVGAQINHRSTPRPAFTRHAAELCTHTTASSHLLYVWTSKGSLNLGKAHKILLTDLTLSPQLTSFSGNSFTWIFVIAAAAWDWWITTSSTPYCFSWRQREFQHIIPKVQSLARLPW